MDWEVVAAVLGGIIVAGTALPFIWRFVKAAARVPFIAEAILHEFSPNGGGSLRDSIDGLSVTSQMLKGDTERLRKTNHDLVNKITAAVGTAQLTAKMVEKQASTIETHAATIAEHTREDHERFGLIDGRLDQVLERLGGIDQQLAAAKQTAEEVKHDLSQFNEIDTLGREGRIERRSE